MMSHRLARILRHHQKAVAGKLPDRRVALPDASLVLRLSDDLGIESAIYRLSDTGWLVLAIPGSDSLLDWGLNLEAIPAFWWERRIWHRGIGLRAAHLYERWEKAIVNCRFIAGFSVGAGIAQMLSTKMAIRAYCYGAPKPLWLGPQHENWEYVTIYSGGADPVSIGRLQGLLGYRHVGRVITLRGVHHSINEYEEALR